MGSKFSVSRMKKELERQTMTSVTTSGDSTVGSGLILSDVGVLTGSGTTVSDAAAIIKHVTAVSGAANSGIYLPLLATTGENYIVSVETTNNLKLYATGSEKLNGVAGATGLLLSGSTGALCVKSGDASWAVVYSRV
jgi:hypothetical protein